MQVCGVVLGKAPACSMRQCVRSQPRRARKVMQHDLGLAVIDLGK